MLWITLRINPHLVLLKVRYAYRLRPVRPVVLLQVLAVIARGHPRKADQLPADLVAVAAIHRIGEKAFLRVSQQQAEKKFRGQRFELDPAVLQRVQDFILLLRREKAKRLAVLPAAI